MHVLSVIIFYYHTFLMYIKTNPMQKSEGLPHCPTKARKEIKQIRFSIKLNPGVITQNPEVLNQHITSTSCVCLSFTD